MAQTKNPHKPTRTPPKPLISTPIPQDIEPSPEPPGQLGTISRGLDEVDGYIDRILNISKNISTRLFGSLAEAPGQQPELPEGELYITPVRLAVIHEGLREIEIILDDAYNKL